MGTIDRPLEIPLHLGFKYESESIRCGENVYLLLQRCCFNPKGVADVNTLCIFALCPSDSLWVFHLVLSLFMLHPPVLLNMCCTAGDPRFIQSFIHSFIHLLGGCSCSSCVHTRRPCRSSARLKDITATRRDWHLFPNALDLLLISGLDNGPPASSSHLDMSPNTSVAFRTLRAADLYSTLFQILGGVERSCSFINLEMR